MKFLNTKSISLAVLATAFFSVAQAQDERDALRFSFLQPQGTARSIGFGSALGSVGGDFTSLSVNPAGIGIYRRSEFMFTPSITFGNTSSDYVGSSRDVSGSHFAFSNIGLVTTKVSGGRRGTQGGWSAVSFGVGLTRQADFTRDYFYSGRNTTSSGSFVFESSANSIDPRGHEYSSTLGDLGYQAYLLDTMGGGYLSVVNPKANAPVSQSMSIQERGGISELGISLGGAYEERLMMGATLGFPIVRYKRSKTFSEEDLSGNTNNDFSNFTYNEDLSTSGAGVNLKLGFIYKPVESFRFGVALHTPTLLSLTDIQNQNLTANTESFGGQRTDMAVENQYDYSLVTPWRAVASATAMFGGFGFFTVDYEYVDYASARFKFSDKQYESEVNNGIKQAYQGASNIRTGVEIRLDNFQLRGGFGYYGNPSASGNDGSSRLDFSGGIGFRFPKAFIDLGFVHRSYKNNEQPYYLAGTTTPGSLYYGITVPTANLTSGTNTAALTLGFKL
jgi:hypothetical protein